MFKNKELSQVPHVLLSTYFTLVTTVCESKCEEYLMSAAAHETIFGAPSLNLATTRYT